MEHAQRERDESHKNMACWVLILILMEHAQRGKIWQIAIYIHVTVLILILMEHAQRGKY